MAGVEQIIIAALIVLSVIVAGVFQVTGLVRSGKRRVNWNWFLGCLIYFGTAGYLMGEISALLKESATLTDQSREANRRVYTAEHDRATPAEVRAAIADHQRIQSQALATFRHTFRVLHRDEIVLDVEGVAVLAFGAHLLFRAIRARRRVQALKRSGCCIHCGYDLRFGGERCPECGARRPAAIETLSG